MYSNNKNGLVGNNNEINKLPSAPPPGPDMELNYQQHQQHQQQQLMHQQQPHLYAPNYPPQLQQRMYEPQLIMYPQMPPHMHHIPPVYSQYPPQVAAGYPMPPHPQMPPSYPPQQRGPLLPPQPHQVGPPPAYGGGAQYPTGYCPAPAYTPPIHAQQYYATAAAAAGATSPNQNDKAMHKAVFDAGSRFNGKGAGSMSIPPPPPGYVPTAAQVAAMQGQTVMMEKRKENFFSGGKGGGFTFW